MQNRTKFLAETRDLASAFINASDTFATLSARFKHAGFADAPESGGLTNGVAGNLLADPPVMLVPSDFTGENADITREDVLLFYQTMAALLLPLTDEQKRVFYRLAK